MYCPLLIKIFMAPHPKASIPNSFFRSHARFLLIKLCPLPDLILKSSNFMNPLAPMTYNYLKLFTIDHTYYLLLIPTLSWETFSCQKFPVYINCNCYSVETLRWQTLFYLFTQLTNSISRVLKCC